MGDGQIERRTDGIVKMAREDLQTEDLSDHILGIVHNKDQRYSHILIVAMSNAPLSLSRLYLKCLGYIFSIAFLSYYAQYPALSSRSGIEPSERVFGQAFPIVYQNIVEKGYSDADSFVELVNVLGVLLSVLIAR